MQFFEHQDQARGRTTLLLTLFAFAVLGLGALAATAVHFVLVGDLAPGEEISEHHWPAVATAAIATWGVILLGSAYRTAQLSGGGVKVAETLGATLVTGGTPDPLERRAVNIVEEMAIAAGLPVPPLYILRQEQGINAFAAGWSPDDAVIGITTGALESLSRDQLQGVVAHEFSHILNRDCALNMRLIGVLHGIVVLSLMGRFLLEMGIGSKHRSTRKEDTGFHFLVVGGAIWIFGSIGVLVARFIQSAVSQQREYLADASAVQFTRNPLGIGGALATIGSQTSALTTPRGGETSHMMISEPGRSSFLGLLASHPPLFDRIRRVLPHWQGDFEELATPAGTVREQLSRQAPSVDGRKIAEEFLSGGAYGIPHIPGVPAQAQAVVNSAFILDQVQPSASATSAPHAPLNQAARLLANIPPALRYAAEDPYSARALIFAWILDKNPDAHEAQMALLSGDAALALETERLFRLMPELESAAILPLFDIAIGSLAALSPRQKAEFLEHLEALEAQLSDRAFRSFCLAALAMRHLDPQGKSHKVTPILIKEAIETMLGVLAVQGHNSLAQAQDAFASGVNRLGKRGAQLELPSAQNLNIQRLGASFATLLRLPNTTRAELLTAAESIASHDGELRPSEAELLRVMATCLSVATPPAFAAHA